MAKSAHAWRSCTMGKPTWTTLSERFIAAALATSSSKIWRPFGTARRTKRFAVNLTISIFHHAFTADTAILLQKTARTAPAISIRPAAAVCGRKASLVVRDDKRKIK